MKIFAAAISILCVVIDQKATVQGGLIDIFRGKDKTPDEASGEGSGGFSGGLSGNLKLPGNILSECSVGGNVNGNIGASPSGGIQGDVNAEVNLPSCDCIRKFDAQGSVGGGGSTGFGGFGVSGGASFGGSLAMPGVNCAETDNPPEEEPNEEQDPSEEQESSEDENSPEEEEVDVTTLPLCADLRKQDLQGSLGSTDTSNKVAPGNRNKDNVFEKISVIIPGVNCYEPEPPEKESEESTEAPEESEESEQSTVAPKESEESEQSTDVYGESEESEESTETPEESKESEQSTEAPEKSEESEQSTEAPEESEESEQSTEAPEESEQSTEAPEESEESEQSTEAPEESEESEQSTEAPEELEESEESTEAPGKNSYCYHLDINRDIIMSPKNNFLTASPVGNADAPAEFYQTMYMDNALQIYQTDLSLDKKLIYDSKPEKKMTNICNDSYPEGSIEANIWKIINLEVMAGKGCPVKKGSGYTFPEWLRGTELTLNEPLEYGNYKLNIDFDTPQGAWALKLLFLFEVNENSECTVKESFDESTEEPEESTEAPEESEESEQSTEAPEESEESEQSTEAPEESEESEQSTEAPEELEESEESTEAPGKNSYCYRLDINRDIIMSPKNNFLTASPVENADAPAEFYQTMNMDNALQIYQTDLSLDKKLIYDSKPEKKMTNICNDSYPEGSIEANIWKIINLEVMAGKGCPVEKGSGYTFPEWLRGTELTLNEPLEYGNYKLNIDFDTPQDAWALKLLILFEVNENSECTVKESFDESTEEPEESTEAPEESEESEQSTEAPEESEESEQSTEAPEESEESEQSTEAPEELEESEESTEAPGKNSYCYRLDINRDIIMSPKNYFLTASPVENADAPAEFYQTMNMDNALQIYQTDLSLDKKLIYDSKPEKKMTNICNDSYPEGSIEANIWKIINLEVMAGKGCPVEKGSGYTFPEWLRGTELTLNEPLEYGNYKLNIDFDTPQDAWALKLLILFEVNENSECTVKESFDESTEEPEESTEAPEESEESEQSTEAPEESEESEQSTEAPEELEESEESTEAPGKNSYCYRLDINRDIIMSPKNNFLTASPVENADAPAEFYQTMNMDNALQIYQTDLSLDKKLIYDSKPEKKMTNICNDSYPEGSIEANIWKIINLEVMAGKGCPVEKGSGYTFPEWLRGTELTLNEPLEYGNYKLNIDFDTPQDAWALKLLFLFEVNENSECTVKESFDESTEAPEESEESEQSTEAPEESEESEQSTEAPEELEESEESTEAPGRNSYCYHLDINRDIIMSPKNNFLTASPVGNADSPAEFYQTMNMDNALQIYQTDLSLDKKLIYDSKPEKKMTNICNDSYPEGSIEANIWKIINLEVMAGKGCPVEKGSGYTFPEWLRGTELTLNEPLEYGNYKLNIDFDTPQDAWALKLLFLFEVNENSECTVKESFDESTEEPEESTEAPEESEESEQSTEAPEESEESEQSTEAPEESEESEQSTEAPEELEESEESTEAPGRNSYCYHLDINRDIIMSPKNNFLTASPVGNADSPAEFYQTMNMDNALQIYQTDLSLDKKLIYDSKPEKKMTNICNDSYPEGSIEANIWKIINLEVMAGKGCPVEKGSGYTFPEWLRGTELTLNEPLEYGNYKLNIDFDTPQGAWALKLSFLFEVNENSECTVKESFDESTEAPEESEESEEESEQCYIVDMDVQVVKIPMFMGVLNKPMDKDNAFKINGADMKVDGKFIYDSRSEEEMTNACEDSYPEGSFQANIWHMFNLGILKGKGCPVEQGSIKTFPKKLDDMQLKINERLEPGDYTAHLDLAAPDGTWAGAIYFYFMLDGPSECKEEEEPQEPIKPFEDESNSNCYKVDIRRSTLLTPENNFLNSSEPTGDVTAEFYQTMDMENALQFYQADISVNKESIYDSKPEKKMTNVCDDSYPEGSIEANIWKIINLEVMAGKGCPVEKGSDYTFPKWLRRTELTFNDPLEYGNYKVHMDFDTPDGKWALGLYFNFVVDENSMCTRP
ncbi:uncharacterized protein LOC123261666 isoform X3 [Cotesia glomerata]|uniref:uncharacterized protein LOC123261666 isoform X3 n=1 Tax=Cotesia glomerata TaxID=32391 RepID=UPI001D026EF5|nr:uncharacterized protein LOC123261666 isoform X3 [Cotesia glomerata]